MFELLYRGIIGDRCLGSRACGRKRNCVVLTYVIDPYSCSQNFISITSRRGEPVAFPSPLLGKISLDLPVATESRKIVAWRTRRHYGRREETSTVRLRFAYALIQPWSLGLVCKCDAIFRPVSRVYNTFGWRISSPELGATYGSVCLVHVYVRVP